MSYKRHELAGQLLSALAAGVLIPAALLAPNAPKALFLVLKQLAKNIGANPKAVRKSLTAVKRKRLVKLAREKGQTVLILSEQGKRRALSFSLQEMHIPRPKRWDGLWRIVLFDIPERRKLAREALRLHLRRLGFSQLQKSCFVFPFECKKEIDFITEFHRIPHYVNYVVAKSIEGEDELKAFYEL